LRTPRGPRRYRRTGGLLALAAALCAAGAGPAFAAASSSPAASASPAAASSSPAAGSGSWTVYHGDLAGTGVAGPVREVDTAGRVWTSQNLDGTIYGEPLAYAGHVYLATENDTVYALSAATGRVAWSAHLAGPVPSGDLPCGDISPTVGITGTPVIDPARNEIFVVADELVNGSPEKWLVGLDTATGRVKARTNVDPPGANDAALLQRTGLTLDAGQVVFGMAGNDGDCASYRGRVVAVPEAGGTPRFFTVDAAVGENQGGIWMGGAAPVVDGAGHVFVSTGNGSVYSFAHAYDDSDSVLELSSSMRLVQYFAPSTWATDNSRDLDMSIAPALLPDGQVLLTGKSRIMYLLDGAHLGGIGHQQATAASTCGADIDGGVAVVGMTVYLPCLSGIIAVQARQSPPGLRVLWSSGIGGGPPIVAAGLVWTMSQNGTLYGLDPATGKVREQAAVGTPANHFPTPSVADGLLLAAAASNVVAFAAPAPGAVAASPVPGSTPGPGAGDTPAPTSGHASPGRGLAALAFVALVVVIGIFWALSRRRGGGAG
jgi:outer membrane protein assembly factor BamB